MNESRKNRKNVALSFLSFLSCLSFRVRKIHYNTCVSFLNSKDDTQQLRFRKNGSKNTKHVTGSSLVFRLGKGFAG